MPEEEPKPGEEHTASTAVDAAVAAGHAQAVVEQAAADAQEAAETATQAADQAADMAVSAVTVTADMVNSMREEIMGSLGGISDQLVSHATRLEALEAIAKPVEEAKDASESVAEETTEAPAEAVEEVNKEVTRARRFRRI